MTAAVLMDRFRARGLVVKIDGPRVLVGPAPRLDDEDRVLIRRHVPGLRSYVLGKSLWVMAPGVPIARLPVGAELPTCVTHWCVEGDTGWRKV